MSLFAILLGGDLSAAPTVSARMAGARVIAADAGMRHAEILGVVPELWVGDFDSEPAGLPPHLSAVERKVFSPDKAKTDGELAIDIAIERGATSLLLVGAFGGPRADHAFLHMALALRLAETGMPVVLTSGAQEGHPLLAGSTRFDFPVGTMFSLLGFTALTGLSETGAKWPLDSVEVPFGSSLTLSNVATGPLSISLASGRALLVAHFAEGI
jgi:thiamine pyrophosphokinase